MLQQAKLKIQENEHDDVAHKIAKLDYILMAMSIRNLKHQEFDWKMFEEVYQELCVQPWLSDDEPKFPINYKAEFLLYFFIEFTDNLSYTRSALIQSLLKGLHERNPENKLAARNYILTINLGFYEGMPYFGSEPTKYLSVADQISVKYEFSREDQHLLNFSNLQSLIRFSIESSFKNSVEIYENIREFCKESKSLYFLSFSMDYFGPIGSK